MTVSEIVMPIRAYKICLGISLAINAILVMAVWAYIHFASTLELVEEAVGFFN